MKNTHSIKTELLSDFLALQMEKENTLSFSEQKEAERLGLRQQLMRVHGMSAEDIALCVREERNFHGN